MAKLPAALHLNGTLVDGDPVGYVGDPRPHVAFPVFEPVSAVLVQGAPVALVLADEGSPALVQLVPPIGGLVCLPAFITFQV